VRHKRSQNTGVMYALVDEVAGVVDAPMSISSRTEDEFGSVPPTGDQRNSRPRWDYSGRAMSVSDVRFSCTWYWPKRATPSALTSSITPERRR
jgi:hypothetical protein